jgi:nucleoside-diphosphate-sugar epimerase
MSKTILFGGSGFLGPIILEKDRTIVSVGRKKPPNHIVNKHVYLKNLNNLKVLDKVNFNKVIFLIGSSNHHTINKNINLGFKYNVQPINKILNYLKNRKIKKFICFTTILLYDEKKLKLPVNEKNPVDPYKNNYIFSKFLTEQIVKFYQKQVPSIIIRLSNLYGYTRLKRPDLVPTIMQEIFQKKKIYIWNDKPERDFIFVEDVADVTLKLLNSSFTGTINVGSGAMHKVRKISDIIMNLSNKKIISRNNKVTGPMRFVTDISLVKKILNWKPKFSLEQGLKKTFFIMKKYYLKK